MLLARRSFGYKSFMRVGASLLECLHVFFLRGLRLMRTRVGLPAVKTESSCKTCVCVVWLVIELVR
jgi:hypothetical protein